MNIITLHLTCAGHEELSQRMMEYKIYECRRPPTRTRMQSGSASHRLQENNQLHQNKQDPNAFHSSSIFAALAEGTCELVLASESMPSRMACYQTAGTRI